MMMMMLLLLLLMMLWKMLMRLMIFVVLMMLLLSMLSSRRRHIQHTVHPTLLDVCNQTFFFSTFQFVFFDFGLSSCSLHFCLLANWTADKCQKLQQVMQQILHGVRPLFHVGA